MKRSTKILNYKQIQVESGYVYVYKIWAGGVVAGYIEYGEYGEVVYRSNISNHKVITNKTQDKRFIRIDSKGKEPVIVGLKTLLKGKWFAASVTTIAELTGVPASILRRVYNQTSKHMDVGKKKEE